jgi:hypothetical protein
LDFRIIIFINDPGAKKLLDDIFLDCERLGRIPPGNMNRADGGGKNLLIQAKRVVTAPAG